MKIFGDRYKMYITFLILIGLGILVSLIASLGYYPIAIADGHIITAHMFWKHYQAGVTYSEKFITTYKPLLHDQNQNIPSAELQASVLDELIENNLIDQEARKQFGNDFSYFLSKKIDGFNNDEKLRQAALTLYGMSFADFRDEVLTPEAEREMLSGKLFLNGKNLNDWLLDKKHSISVRIFSGSLHWTGEKVETKT
jgi:hypothetical protein